MKIFSAKLNQKLSRLRTSYLLIPGLFSVTALLIVTLSLSLDRLIVDMGLTEILQPRWVFTSSAEGARSLLSTVASSMITVTGVIFSITIVSLSLASQQFGPRLLQNFLRDRSNQTVLGLITATYLFCLLVMRTVNGEAGTLFVPNISVLIAVILAVLCVGALIFFLHHAVHSIQVTRIIENVHDDTLRWIDRSFPTESDLSNSDHHGDLETTACQLAHDPSYQQIPVLAQKVGYIQSIDIDAMVTLAEQHNAVVQLQCRTGHFVSHETEMAVIYLSAEFENFDALHKDALANIGIGRKRTPDQDLEFLVNELVEIAVRALSPGVNDPFTAMSCIDHLGSILRRLATTPFPDPIHRDQDGRVRALGSSGSYEGLVKVAFQQIRQNGQSIPPVAAKLLDTWTAVILLCHRKTRLQAVQQQVEQLWQNIQQQNLASLDFADLKQRYAAFMHQCEIRLADQNKDCH